MLSISTCSAKMAETYYEQDDYYTRSMDQETDRWQGSREDVQITDGEAVDPAKFQAILESEARKNCAIDLTFSAPKSVSIACELEDQRLRAELLQAHREAVSETMQTIMQDLNCRRKERGQIIVEKAVDPVAAKFEHNVSRNQDPQLHTHCVLLNEAHVKDRPDLYALDARPLYLHKIASGAEYRARLAKKIRELGFEIETTDAEKGLFELKGIRADALENFSTRRAEIEARMRENGEHGAEASAHATLDTRSAKKHCDIEARRAEWREYLREIGQESPKRGQPTAPTEDEQRKAYRVAVDALQEKSYAWTAEQLEKEIVQRGVGCGMTRARAAELVRADSQLVKMQPTTDSGLQARTYYTTASNMQREQEIAENVLDGLGRGHGLGRDKAKAALDAACKKNGWNLQRGGITEQYDMVLTVTANTDRSQFRAVRGLAGVGKTFALNAAREVWERQGYEVRGMAATGQAADELAIDAHLNTSTIHAALNRLEKEAGNAVPGENYEHKKSWNLDGLKPAAKPTVWIVDEASLVDDNLFWHIQKAARLRGDTVVFVGDDRQMPPVGCGQAFANLVQGGKIPCSELKNIQRQKDAQLLAAVREAVGGRTKASLDMIAERITEIPTPKRRAAAVARAYTDLPPEEQAETLVLTARNADRIDINNRIRATLVKQGRIEQGTAFTVRRSSDDPPQQRFFAPGDKLIFLRNDKKLGVKNGTRGVIVAIDGACIRVDCGKSKGIVEVDTRKYAALDHGYCQTPNKAQGATVSRAIINMSSKDAGLNSKNSYYVDISRAKHNVQLFVDDREKLEPQLQNFCRKITAQDFAKPPARRKGNFKAARKSGPGISLAGPPILLPVKVVLKGAEKVAKLAAKTVKQGIKLAAKPLQPEREQKRRKSKGMKI